MWPDASLTFVFQCCHNNKLHPLSRRHILLISQFAHDVGTLFSHSLSLSLDWICKCYSKSCCIVYIAWGEESAPSIKYHLSHLKLEELWSCQCTVWIWSHDLWPSSGEAQTISKTQWLSVTCGWICDIDIDWTMHEWIEFTSTMPTVNSQTVQSLRKALAGLIHTHTLSHSQQITWNLRFTFFPSFHNVYTS